jgi:molybdopterin/thiamine biosynthesis adenylyltransferase
MMEKFFWAEELLMMLNEMQKGRYNRNILISEIGEQGQKNFLKQKFLYVGQEDWVQQLLQILQVSELELSEL